MNAIIRRFDRAPLEDRLLRANPAQPPKSKGPVRPTGGTGPATQTGGATPPTARTDQRPPRRHKKSSVKRQDNGGAQSAFAEELAKVL